MVSTPANAQATSSHPALPIVRAMSADTMKMPEPIMMPTTTITESNRPSPRAKLREPGVPDSFVTLEAVRESVLIGFLLAVSEARCEAATYISRGGGYRRLE